MDLGPLVLNGVELHIGLKIQDFQGTKPSNSRTFNDPFVFQDFQNLDFLERKFHLFQRSVGTLHGKHIKPHASLMAQYSQQVSQNGQRLPRREPSVSSPFYSGVWGACCTSGKGRSCEDFDET
jgi:hypothetical protein